MERASTSGDIFTRRNPQNLSPPKLPKPGTQTRDRLTTLPDPVLLHILSFLPTEEVIKTSLLSTQWKTLWISTPTLSFTHHPTLQDPIKFISFVDKTLLLSTPHNHKLEKFALNFPYQSRFSSTINFWLMFITKHGVQDVDLNLLNLHDFGFFDLPRHFYKNGCFVKLSLVMCGVVPNEVVNWKLLRVLKLGSTELMGDAVKNLVLGSPVLEVLELCDCWGFNKLEICGSGSLRKLVIDGYSDWGKKLNFVVEIWQKCVVEIWAPSVRVLEILGCWHGRIVRLENVSSVVDAKLDFYVDRFYVNYGDADDEFEIVKYMLSDMLGNLQHVKYLTFGTWCIEILSMLGITGLPSAFLKCKSLMLDTPIQEQYLSGIVNLLQSSPNAETLVINIAQPPSFEFEIHFSAKYSQFLNVNGESYWTSKQRLFKCSDLRLKNIKVLEKMIINDWGAGQQDLSPNELEDRYQVAQSLISFSRSSKESLILFKP